MLKLFENDEERIAFEATIQDEPYVSVTREHSEYSAIIGGISTSDVVKNNNDTYTVTVYFDYGASDSITVSSMHCIYVNIAVEDDESQQANTNLLRVSPVVTQSYELDANTLVDGQNATVTIDGNTYYFEYSYNSWNVYTDAEFTNYIGYAIRVDISNDESQDFVHYKKAKLATLTLTDDSVLTICKFRDKTRTMQDLLYRAIMPYVNNDTIKHIIIEDSIKTINIDLYGVSNLVSVTFRDPININIERLYLRGCTSLESINIMSNTPLYSTTSQMFMNCSNLRSFTIPDSCTYIAGQTFLRCTSLTSITIPAGVTYLGMEAFYGCTALTSITCLATTPPNTYTNPFKDVNSSCIVYVPAESVAAYKAHSSWQIFGNRIQAIQ